MMIRIELPNRLCQSRHISCDIRRSCHEDKQTVVARRKVCHVHSSRLVAKPSATSCPGPAGFVRVCFDRGTGCSRGPPRFHHFS